MKEHCFGNDKFKVDNKSLLFPHWQNSRISKIKHIWDIEEQKIKNKNPIPSNQNDP
jgi:hypothetical protein